MIVIKRVCAFVTLRHSILRCVLDTTKGPFPPLALLSPPAPQARPLFASGEDKKSAHRQFFTSFFLGGWVVSEDTSWGPSELWERWVATFIVLVLGG